jgi:signal transduction histidine kinase
LFVKLCSQGNPGIYQGVEIRPFINSQPGRFFREIEDTGTKTAVLSLSRAAIDGEDSSSNRNILFGMGQDYKIGGRQSRSNIVIINLKTELTQDLRRITIVRMLFRSKIFATIFIVGLLPAVILLVISAYLINSTLQRVGASGLESSVEAAGTLVHDSESKTGEILENCLSEKIPWNRVNDLDDRRRLKKLDLIYRNSGDTVFISVSDSLGVYIDSLRNITFKPGISHRELGGRTLLVLTRGDSMVFEGCGILMPPGYAERGRRLSNAIAAAASLSLYKDFSIQLLSVVTGASLLFLLFAGLILSRLISGQLVKPLEKLTEGARKLGSGDLEHRVEITGGDELARLADSFNRMASEIKTNQEKLIESEKLAAWREVARRIAHEIKNPLTPMGVELYRLKTMLTAIDNRETESMTGALAGQFSTFAREPKLQKQKCSITDILNRTIELYDNLDHVTISKSFEDNLPLVGLDPQMMGRVFGNIIKNSMEASPESVNIDIKVETEWPRLSAGETGEYRYSLYHYQEKRHRPGTGYYQEDHRRAQGIVEAL